MDEEAAYEWFKQARWPSTGGEPTCPECGLIGASPRRRRRFRCRAKVCVAEFSVTSGTILASRKLSFKTLLMAIALSVHSVKGKAAFQLKRELGVDYKTAFVLLHKLREAVAALRITVKLEGVVEMDGMYVGGHVRPKNEKAKRVDRRLAENRTGKRMAVMVLRERAGDNMTLAAAVPGEQGDVAWHLTKNHVAPASLRADQHPAYDELGGLNEIVRNNHDRAYVVEADFSTNQAESFFSRVRRGEIGIFHHIAGKYLDWYAADLAWREDKRRTDFKLHADAVLKSALTHAIVCVLALYVAAAFHRCPRCSKRNWHARYAGPGSTRCAYREVELRGPALWVAIPRAKDIWPPTRHDLSAPGVGGSPSACCKGLAPQLPPPAQALRLRAAGSPAKPFLLAHPDLANGQTTKRTIFSYSQEKRR